MLQLFHRSYLFPKTVVAAALLLVIASTYILFDFVTLKPRFQVDPSMTALLPAAGAELEIYQQARQLFGNDDVLLVAWIDEQLFTPDGLNRFRSLVDEIEQLPGVLATDSLASALDVRVNDELTRVDPYLRDLPTNQADADALRQRALNDRLVKGRLISNDANALMLAVRFEDALDTPTLIRRVDEIHALSKIHAGAIEQILSGPLLIRLEISRMLYRDLAHVIPLAILFTLLVAVIGFRSLRGVILPFCGNFAAAALTVAAFVHNGHAFNFVTVILPPVVYVIGFAYAIHVVCAFDRHFGATRARQSAIKQTLNEVQLPLSLTALTTVIAFLALALSPIESVRIFGVYTAIGVSLAWLGAMTVVPAGLVLVPAAGGGASDVRSSSGALLTRLCVHHRGKILSLTVIAVVLSLSGIRHLEADTRVLNNFDSSTSLRTDFERLAEVFSGPVPIWVVLRAEQPQAFKSPENLAAITELESWLVEQPEVGASLSLAGYVDSVHRAVAPAHHSEHGRPTSERFVNHLLLIGGTSDVRLFADSAFQTTLIRLRTTALSTAEVNHLTRRISARLAEVPAHLEARVTGTSAIIAGTVDDLTRGQIRSLFFAFAGVFVVLCLLFRSLRLGIISLVPNVLPVLFYFGVLGYSPIPLSLTTSLVACAVFGIAIDDSVHFLSRFSIESRRAGTPTDALRNTLGAVLKPVTLTTGALCAGFLALGASELGSQADFGLLAALTLFFAWLIDLSFTPALCSRFLKLKQPGAA